MNRPLRIAVFAGIFPSLSETFILRQITGLLALGHQVDIYADTRGDASAPVHPDVAQFRLLERTTFMDMPAESAPWELPVWPLTGQTWLPGASLPTANWRRLVGALPAALRCALSSPRFTLRALRPAEFGYQASSLSALFRLAKLSERAGDYDVLHAHFGPVGNSFRFARDLWRAPLLVSFHGYDFSTQPRKEGAGMYQKLFHIADLVTVNSAYTQRCVEKLGCPTHKLRRLPVGLDLQEFRFRERTLEPGEPVRLLTVARLTPIKGHEYILRALARLHQAGVAFRYDVVGDGVLRKALTQLAHDLGLAEKVRFHGACAADQVKTFYEQAHLFLLCSVAIEGDQEGQGLALQEAQACGLPVIATAHGALPEGMLPGQSGLLVPEHSVDELAAQLRSLLEQNSQWGAMGRAGRAFVEKNYDISQLNSQLVSYYTEAVEKAGVHSTAAID